MDTEDKAKSGMGLGGIALLTGIVALVLAVFAYNRAGEPNLGEQIQQEADDVAENIEDEAADLAVETEDAIDTAAETTTQAAARAQLQAQLAAMRDEIADGQVTDETVATIEEMRLDLREAYSDASGDLQANLDDIDAELETLQTEVRENVQQALNRLDLLIERLQNSDLNE